MAVDFLGINDTLGTSKIGVVGDTLTPNDFTTFVAITGSLTLSGAAGTDFDIATQNYTPGTWVVFTKYDLGLDVDAAQINQAAVTFNTFLGASLVDTFDMAAEKSVAGATQSDYLVDAMHVITFTVASTTTLSIKANRDAETLTTSAVSVTHSGIRIGS